MKSSYSFTLACVLAASATLVASPTTPEITGNYLEVRSCDIFTGPCFANSEMGQCGKEGILVWNVKQGSYQGVNLDGLSVIAVVRANDLLGDVNFQPRQGKAVIIVDQKADAAQKEALIAFARSQTGNLIKEVASVKTAKMEVEMATCGKAGCATVKAGNLVEISSRCLGDKDHLCGNENLFYPPLSSVDHPMAAFSELAAYRGDGLGMTWQGVGQRNVYLGGFSK